MPAMSSMSASGPMTADPITASLSRSLTGSTGGFMRGGNSSSVHGSSLDARLAANSAKKSLLSNSIQFDSPMKYVGGSSTSSDKSSPGKRFIVLNPIRQKPPPSTSEEGDSSNGAASGTSVPKPKTVFYPLSSVEVGYRVKRSAGSGMFNVGNTCYLNSTLQALFHTPALFNYLTMGDGSGGGSVHTSRCSGSTSGHGFIQNCTICALSHTLRDTLRPTNQVIKPNRIYEKLKSICKHMVHGRQEDAHEFLRYLIESLQRSFLHGNSSHCLPAGAIKTLDNASKETTPFNQIFGGYMRQDVTCLKCRHVSTTFQHFMDILLDIRQVSTIEEALRQYFRPERIDDNMYKCERCKIKVPATKRYLMERPPAVLCVQLKRFTLMGGKISKPVQLQRQTDLSPFIKTSGQRIPVNYKLVAMITHVGPSPNCGHYTAIGEAAGGQFYQFDDCSVRPISQNQALNTASYVVFYEMTPSSWSSVTASEAQKARTKPTATVTSGPPQRAYPQVQPHPQVNTNVSSSGTKFGPQAPHNAPLNGVNGSSAAKQPKISFHRSSDTTAAEAAAALKPKIINLGSSTSATVNKLGIVTGVAKNAVASFVRTVTSAAAASSATATSSSSTLPNSNGGGSNANKKGPSGPLLVPYDDDDEDSDDSSALQSISTHSGNSKQKTAGSGGGRPAVSNAPSPTPSSTSSTNSGKKMLFLPRSVAVNNKQQHQSPKPVPPQGGSNGNPATLGGSSLPAAGPPVERKNSSSGVWTVTDVDQHNPSVNSDNSTGSTSGSWVIKPASANTPPPPPKTNGHSSIQSPVKKPLTPHTNGSKGPDLSRSDGYEQIAQRGDLKGSATTTVRTVVDEGAFAKSLATDTPRKRANNGSSSNGRGESGDFDDDDEYDADFDRGRTKKVKKSSDSHHQQSFNSKSFNPFQKRQDQRQQHSDDGGRRGDSLNRSYSGRSNNSYHFNGSSHGGSQNGQGHSSSSNNKHVDSWHRRSNHGGGGFQNKANGGGGGIRRKSFGGVDFRNSGNNSNYKNGGKNRNNGYGGGGFGSNNSSRRSYDGGGGGGGYRSNNDHRDYYGNRHHQNNHNRY